MQNPSIHLNYLSTKSKVIFFLGSLLIVAITPTFLHSQWITGPIINATLILNVLILGPYEAVILALFPSTMALASGLLPAPLAPMIPFIIISNCIMISKIHFLRNRSYFIAITLSAIAKALFLFGIVTLVMPKFLNAEILNNLLIMMTWPQLATALMGGVLAYTIFKILQKYEKPHSEN